MRIIVTGGAGFIGSALVRFLINETDSEVVNVDKLTYAGNLQSLEDVSANNRYAFERIDICDQTEVERIFEQYKPDSIMHLAAESHVDRSIDGPSVFITTNIVGTYTLLEVARTYWGGDYNSTCREFKFLHVSTDEVFGSLGKEGFFTETTSYKPNSPYSASKAASDHLVRAWNKTYGFPIILTNCSNNYGPYQFPEKLIPVIILNALAGKPIPIYGKGDNIRDWLYVEDHAKALYRVLLNGGMGETYNVGGNNEKSNLEVVHTICEILDELQPSTELSSYSSLITFVEDRPGHDQRYAIDSTKIRSELNWTPEHDFRSGVYDTVKWYLGNMDWVENVKSGRYQGERLGLGTIA